MKAELKVGSSILSEFGFTLGSVGSNKSNS